MIRPRLGGVFFCALSKPALKKEGAWCISRNRHCCKGPEMRAWSSEKRNTIAPPIKNRRADERLPASDRPASSRLDRARRRAARRLMVLMQFGDVAARRRRAVDWPTARPPALAPRRPPPASRRSARPPSSAPSPPRPPRCRPARRPPRSARPCPAPDAGRI